MLARASSDAGTRLRRSKSTSTVHRHAPLTIEPLDPDVAQQQAIAAATAAFTRSQAQASSERKANRSIELARSKSTASRKSLTSQGSHFPPRELSTRSVPTQKSTQTAAHRLFVASTSNTEKFPPLEPTPGNDKPFSSARPLSAQPSVTFSEYARPSSQPKSHRQSAASSITSQQIRKARSMYYASSIQTGSPIARPPAKYLTTPPSISPSHALSNAPTTYIPTRSTGPSPLAVPRVPVAVAHDETVDQARDKYLQEFQQRSVKHKPSLFLAPFKKRQDKLKDKGKRLSSNMTSIPSTSYQVTGESAVNITVNDFMPQPNTKDRRSFSGSLKRKIKRVFRRPLNKLPNLPVQQIEASRDYFETIDTIVPHVDGHDDIPSPDEVLLQRVRSRTPSLNGGRPRLALSASRSSSKSSVRSDRSLHSEANVSHASASRVTSWGTSTSGETLTQRAMKRLTVIHEAKDSIASTADRSTSTSIKRKSLPLPALSAFGDPMHMESFLEEASTPPVNPKRVFSALMREIDASKATETPSDPCDRTPGAESDVFESSKTKELHFTAREIHASASKDVGLSSHSEQKHSARRPASVTARSIQSKKSSIRSFGQAVRTTIRTVTPGEHRSSPCPYQLADAQADTSTPSSSASSRSQSDREGHTSLFKSLRIHKKKSIMSTQDVSTETSAPTTDQIEIRVAKAKNRWQTPLNESATPQFPRETDRLYTAVDFDQQKSAIKASATLVQPVSPQSPEFQLTRPIETPLSPSVYSRNTDGISILPNDSVMSFKSPYEHERTHYQGSAVILTSQSVRSYIVGTPSPNRPSSTRSSRDWKAWLSHEVSGIEATSQEDITIHGQYAKPSGLHKRDLNQTVRTSHTGSEDTTVIVRDSLDVPKSRRQSEQPATLELRSAEQQEVLSTNFRDSLLRSDDMRGTTNVHRHTDEGTSMNSTSFPLKLEQVRNLSSDPVLTPNAHQSRSTSTPNSSSSTVPLGTPTSTRMNERFPYLVTGRRLSNHSSRLSHSKSPVSNDVSSLKASKVTPRTKAIYSDTSAPASGSTTRHRPDTAVKRAESPQKAKENITPPSMGGHKRPDISPLGLVSRPKSLQPLSSTASNAQYTANEGLESKRGPSPAGTVLVRPGLRITIRPLSPDKLSRRPRSTFDLRNTPSPRPASELPRPVLQHTPSSRRLGQSMSADIGAGTVCDGINENRQRDGSVTPGQRMADRFLKERKSATVLERGVRKSAGKVVREDTPAFL